MIVSTDPDYLDTKLIKQGVKQLDPVFQELAEWIHEKFDTQVLNIYYDKIDTDKDRPRLNIIFEYYHDAVKFRDHIGNFDSNKQMAIAEKFRQILSKAINTNHHFFTRLIKKTKATKFDTTRLLVIFDGFEPIAREEVNAKIPQSQIDKLRRELGMKEIWNIYREFSTTTFFFLTENQIEQFKNDGTTELIKTKYFDILKKYDEFDYFKPDTAFLTFDSKENFDKNFESNWFYYSRR
jgi:hypothetical protein